MKCEGVSRPPARLVGACDLLFVALTTAWIANPAMVIGIVPGWILGPFVAIMALRLTMDALYRLVFGDTGNENG